METPLYPLFIDLHGQAVLVVGGGAVAKRKCQGLLQAGADITVVSPHVEPAIFHLACEGRLVWRQRAYIRGEASAYTLVFAATDDVKVNGFVYEDARLAGRLVNMVNDQSQGNCVVPSVVRRGDLAIALTTSGASPALARLFRERLEKEWGVEYETFMMRAKTLRKELLEQGRRGEEIREIFKQLLDSPVLELFRQGRHDEADAIIRRVIDRQGESV